MLQYVTAGRATDPKVAARTGGGFRRHLELPMTSVALPDEYILVTLLLSPGACPGAGAALSGWDRRHDALYWVHVPPPDGRETVLQTGVSAHLSVSALNDLLTTLAPFGGPEPVFWEYIPATAPPPPLLEDVWVLHDALLLFYRGTDGTPHALDFDTPRDIPQGAPERGYARRLLQIGPPHPRHPFATLLYHEGVEGTRTLRFTVQGERPLERLRAALLDREADPRGERHGDA